MFKTFNRRDAARLALFAPLAALAAGTSLRAFGQQMPPDLDTLFGSPETPTFGPEDADVTIAAFLDYNCPFCKLSAPHFKALRESDPKIKVIFKDWPILTPASVTGAQQALAAHRQGEYLAAHDALMAIPGTGASPEDMRAALEASPVDMAAGDATLASEGAALLDQLRTTLDQADEAGITGTPAWFIGPYFVGGALDLAQFEDAVAQARAAA